MSGAAVADLPASQAPNTAPTPAAAPIPVPAATAPVTPPAPVITPPADSKIPESAKATEPAKPTDAKPADTAPKATGLLDKLTAKPDEKPTDAKPAEVKPGDAPADANAWKLAAPQGVTLSADAVAGVETWAKAQGLTMKQAEAVLARDGAAQSDQQASLGKFFTSSSESFEKHAELGGPNLPASLAHINRALNSKLMPAELKAVLTNPAHSFVNYAPMAELLARVGAILGEDGALPSGHAPNRPKNDGELFYGPKKS